MSDEAPRDLVPSHQVTTPAVAGGSLGIVGALIAVKFLGIVDPLQIAAVGSLISQLFSAGFSYLQQGGRRGEV